MSRAKDQAQQNAELAYRIANRSTRTEAEMEKRLDDLQDENARLREALAGQKEFYEAEKAFRAWCHEHPGWGITSEVREWDRVTKARENWNSISAALLKGGQI